MSDSPTTQAYVGPPVDREELFQWIEDLSNPSRREVALLEFSKKRDSVGDLPIWLWRSFGTVAALLQEVIAIYPAIMPSSLTTTQSNRVLNALMQCIASHEETRGPFLSAHIPLFLYPFLHTTKASRPFEYLSLTSLGVIGALVKTDEKEVIQFLLSTEIIPLCLRIMEQGTELSKDCPLSAEDPAYSERCQLTGKEDGGLRRELHGEGERDEEEDGERQGEDEPMQGEEGPSSTRNIFSSSFDLIVMGSGLAEAMLASAAARSGASVLLLDECNFFETEWNRMDLRTFDAWVRERRLREDTARETGPEPNPSFIHEGESLTRIRRRPTINILRDEWTQGSAAPSTRAVPAADAAAALAAAPAPPPPSWRADAEDHWDQFWIDLSPKVVLSRGDLARTLCDSDVSAYAEFTLVDRLLGLTQSEDLQSIDISRLPSSTWDFHDGSWLKAKDKMSLWLIKDLCLRWHVTPEKCAVVRAAASTPFSAFLSSRGIHGSLAHMLTRSLSFLCPAGDSPTTEQAMGGLCRYMDSVGSRASPFFLPLGGSRALREGLYRHCTALRSSGRPVEGIVEGIVENGGSVRAVLVAGQRVECKHLLMTCAYAPQEWISEDSSTTVSRAVLISNGSLKEAEKESISLLNLGGVAPAAGGRLLEVGNKACTAPRGYFLSQITAVGGAASEGLVDDVIQKMYRREEVKEGDEDEKKKPLLLRRIEWLQKEYATSGANVPENVGLLRLPDASADYSSVMEEAKALFARFWSDRDFLPRALKKESRMESHSMRETKRRQ